MTKPFDLNEYLNCLLALCQERFGERLLYMGLQGSWLRGETNDRSDVDVMLLLDRFTVSDMDAYRALLERAGFPEKACGFIAGKDEITRWNPLEVCQLLHTTKDLYGALKDYLPEASREDEVNYVKFSLGNLYHELCHRYIHSDPEKNRAKFCATCKGLFFLIQNLHYLESGRFAGTKQELQERVTGEDRKMLSMAGLPDDYDVSEAFSEVFRWCQEAFLRAAKLG